MNETNLPHPGPHVKVPDEIWFNVLRLNQCCPAGGFLGKVRLFGGQVLEQMIVSDRGYILGRIAPGLAGAHGDIDSSMLTFSTEDIEAVQVPAFRFWQRPHWVSLNPDHPARRAWQERAKQ
jgi:hypothetical protein